MSGNRAAYADWLGNTNDITRMFLAASQIPDLINIAGGLPEPSVYPVKELAEIAERAVSDFPEEALNYPPIEGLPRFRDHIAERFSTDGVKLGRENVLITTGGMQGLDLVGKALLNEGALVATQSPAYLGAIDAWRPRMPQYRPFYPGRNDFEPAKVFKGAQFSYSVPNFSNPSGKLIDTNQRQAMVDASHDTGTWLIEDDPYGTLYYDSEPLPRMLAMSAAKQGGVYCGPVIYMGTLSKEVAPGLRVGWVIADPEMIEKLTIVKQGSDMCTSGLSQLVALEALSGGLAEKILPLILDTYRTRRDALCAAMDEHLSDLFEWEKPVGGMFVWAVARNPDVNTDDILEEALRYKVCVSPSSAFDPEGKYKRAFRINFTLNPPDRLTEGISRLASATRNYISTRG
ncbi:MAG: PLP-dependent aminotransferase family protein [Rhizobiaceae bacterium]